MPAHGRPWDGRLPRIRLSRPVSGVSGPMRIVELLMPSLFQQNVIAIIWDFDKTLIPGYMQEPIFEHYGVDGTTFWHEANGLKDFYGEHGLDLISPDTLYLTHMLTYVQQGVFSGLSNKALREFGARLTFCDG